MAKFSLYNISLKTLSEGTHTFEYVLDQKFFDAIDGDEVRKGTVTVTVMVKRTAAAFHMNFDLKGVIRIPCTRCLDDMPYEVDTQNRLIVKFGKAYSEESDEIVIIPEDEGAINIAWFLYEFIALSVPIKHVHPAGECNKAVYSKLRKHRAVDPNDEEDAGDVEEENYAGDEEDTEAIDPRWETLKGLNFEDN